MGIFKKLFGKNLPPDPIWTVFERYLTPDHRIYPLAEARSTLEQVDAVARTLGVVFPQDYVAHLVGRAPGVYIEAKPEIWPRAQEYDVGPFWSFLYGVHTFTASADSEPWMRLAQAGAEFQQRTGMRAAPILKVIGDADVYCVDAAGGIVQYCHETDEMKATEFSTFGALFDREVKALRTRTDRKKNGG